MDRRPDQPWQPATFRVFRITSSTRRRRDTSGADKDRKPRTVYDVRYRADGYDFRYRFEQKGWAEAFVRQLQENFAKGWLFDTQARRFVDPATAAPREQPLTVFEHFQDYIERKWRGWAPSSRKIAQADLARACMHLVRPDAPPPTAAEERRALDYLRTVAFMPDASKSAADEWRAWFLRWSLPLADVTDEHLQTYIDDVRDRGPDGKPRRLAPSSLVRTRAVVQGAFTYAVKRRLIEWHQWSPVHIERSPDRHHVDPDLVMDPAQVMAMAEACGQIDRRYLAYVLVQGVCGLRPGEAAELRRRDVRRADGHPVTLRVRATRSDAPERFFLDHEERRRPLKGHGSRFTRKVPVPAALGATLDDHLRQFVEPAADARLFTTSTGRPINPSNFQRGVWQHARNQVFPAGHPLRNVRRHDLRHSAITGWLGAGVPLKTAQQWSGHRTLSVLLDTYAGVLESDEFVAVTRLDAFLANYTDAVP